LAGSCPATTGSADDCFIQTHEAVVHEPVDEYRVRRPAGPLLQRLARMPKRSGAEEHDVDNCHALLSIGRRYFGWFAALRAAIIATSELMGRAAGRLLDSRPHGSALVAHDGREV